MDFHEIVKAINRGRDAVNGERDNEVKRLVADGPLQRPIWALNRSSGRKSEAAGRKQNGRLGRLALDRERR